MTKQEEIEKGIREEYMLFLGMSTTPGSSYRTTDFCTKHLLNYLHSQGMVLKVKCPDCAWSQFKSGESVAMTPCQNCNSTGYITEPLIKEI